MINHSEDITILGYAGTASECPFNTETWAINQAGVAFPKKHIDYCFAFDKLPAEYISRMKANAPVISWQDYADIHYPLDGIVKKFHTQYFVNTVCYMIAYALYIGVKRLSLYGCDTFLGATWQRESKGVEYWLGRAEERGVELVLPSKSGLLRPMQGRPYDKHGREILLTLGERLTLLKILIVAGSGDYWSELYYSTLDWILSPKKNEQKQYKITMGYDSAGEYTAVCPEEFRIDIPMSEDIWNYLRKLLFDYERDFGLTENMLGLYEMLTTAEWKEGEYEALK